MGSFQKQRLTCTHLVNIFLLHHKVKFPDAQAPRKKMFLRNRLYDVLSGVKSSYNPIAWRRQQCGAPHAGQLPALLAGHPLSAVHQEALLWRHGRRRASRQLIRTRAGACMCLQLGLGRLCNRFSCLELPDLAGLSTFGGLLNHFYAATSLEPVQVRAHADICMIWQACRNTMISVLGSRKPWPELPSAGGI